MKYLCLIYYPEAAVDGMTDAQWQALVDRCLTYGEGLRASGHMLGGEPLRPVAETRTVQVRDGAMTVTDGPFAETREQLAGFYLIEAADMDEATAIAARIPPAPLGHIEVRPVRQLPER
ncbi:YciI family protein [Stutzerimonas azotifigens]|uniref:YciI family protein n=1 Tax=Stutzerimonas azotifigens TaxID=291995 RepID=UPI00041D80BB|nr:YciI family protein [Stutzerimonas azotifigens]